MDNGDSNYESFGIPYRCRSCCEKNEDGTISAVPTDSSEHQGVELLNYRDGQKITDSVAVKSIFDKEKHQARQMLALQNNSLNLKDLKM
ncbi:hypothetical protein [Streptococcus sp. X13SY08]|uniref:hypothetical protein n=1 Tax=Streptococcus sp. X13SY08 TaxID=1676616 RepID=UPI00128BF4D1|nr:hypothetical protein [Streptococcus sp. X13SY08]